MKWKTALMSWTTCSTTKLVFSNITSEPSSAKVSKAQLWTEYFGHWHYQKRKTVIQQVFIHFLCTDTVRFKKYIFFLHWDLSVDKNSLSVSPADKILAEHIQTIDGQRLAWQHVSGLQAALAGVSSEPGTDERLVPSSWGHCAVWHHAVVSAPWKANNRITLYRILSHIMSHIMSCDWGHHHSGPTWT